GLKAGALEHELSGHGVMVDVERTRYVLGPGSLRAPHPLRKDFSDALRHTRAPGERMEHGANALAVNGVQHRICAGGPGIAVRPVEREGEERRRESQL